MTTRKNLSAMLREGMQNPSHEKTTVQKTTTSAKIQEKENQELLELKSELELEKEKIEHLQQQQEVMSLKLELEEEKIKVLSLEQQLQQQQETMQDLSQSLKQVQDLTQSLQQAKEEQKKFIVPVGVPRYSQHLVILPATSTVLTDEQIGWFD